MMNSTQLSTTMSGKHLDADSQARLVFDRMAVDFAGMARRTDVDFIFSKQPDPLSGLGSTGSSDLMFFYSEAPAYYDSTLFSGTTNTSYKSTVSLTGYSCVNASGTTAALPAYSLVRFSKGLTWDAAPAGSGAATPPGGMVFLTSTASGATLVTGSNSNAITTVPIPASTLAGNPNWSGDIGTPPTYTPTNQTDYEEYADVLSTAVIRMEYCFEVKDLTNPNSPGSAYSNYPIAHYGSTAVNTGTATSFTRFPYPFTANGLSHPIVGDRWYDTTNNRAYVCTSTGAATYWVSNGMADVKAIVVAIAILDPTSRKLLSAQQLGEISGALVDPSEDTTATGLLASPPHLMGEVWQNALNAPKTTFANMNISNVAASQVRVYQRFFYLNNL
jgi:hypothetical protein